MGNRLQHRIMSPASASFEATFDVLVIGGGHAGTEAAVAAARSGASVALVTGALEQIGQLSCNPAIGGIAKGTVVREVDALGGIIARATDLAMVQFRIVVRVRRCGRRVRSAIAACTVAPSARYSKRSRGSRRCKAWWPDCSLTHRANAYAASKH